MGGYVERLDWADGDAWCNEEGLAYGLPVNPVLANRIGELT